MGGYSGFYDISRTQTEIVEVLPHSCVRTRAKATNPILTQRPHTLNPKPSHPEAKRLY